jgi:hypothetical protein
VRKKEQARFLTGAIEARYHVTPHWRGFYDFAAKPFISQVFCQKFCSWGFISRWICGVELNEPA